MKIIGISASPRKGGNTDIIVKEALNAAKAAGADIEFVPMAGKEIKPCDACEYCLEQKRCKYEDDALAIYEKMIDADGIIIGAPVYFGDAPAPLKALIDRSRIMARTGNSLDGKVGASIGVAWKWGHVNTLETIDSFLLINKAVVTSTGGIPGLGLMVFAREKGEVEKNEEAILGAKALGTRVVETVKRMAQ